MLFRSGGLVGVKLDEEDVRVGGLVEAGGVDAQRLHVLLQIGRASCRERV